MTDDVVELDMSANEVRKAVMSLGLLRDSIEGQYAKYVETVSTLYRRRAWIADGSESWEAFAHKHNIPISPDREDRQMLTVALTTEGMSTRAIAPLLSVSQKTIVKDRQAAEVIPVVSGDVVMVQSIDGKQHPAVRLKREPEAPKKSPPEKAAAKRVFNELGLLNDIRLYLRALSSSKEIATMSPAGEKHLIEAFRECLNDLVESSDLDVAFGSALRGAQLSVERLAQLTTDPRFAEHREDLRDDNETQIRSLSDRLSSILVHDLFEAPRRKQAGS